MMAKTMANIVVDQRCSHFFSMRPTYKMTESKLSTCHKNAKHLIMIDVPCITE